MLKLIEIKKNVYFFFYSAAMVDIGLTLFKPSSI